MKNKNTDNKSWEEYCLEYQLDDSSKFYAWQKYLWAKNASGGFVVDLSKKNIQRCEELYRKNPDDFNNCLRLFLLKLFSGQKFQCIPSRILQFIEKRGTLVISHIGWLLGEDEKIYQSIKPYIPQLNNFLLCLNDIKPNLFKDIVYDFEEAWYTLRPLSRIVEISDIFENSIDLESILSIEVGDILAEGGEECYALAEYCYKTHKWVEAFCLFEKIKIACKFYDGGKVCISGDIFKNLVTEKPTMKIIKERSSESFKKAIKAGEQDKLYHIIVRINEQKEKHGKQLIEQAEDIEKHQLVSRIFYKMQHGYYNEANEIWKKIDKDWIKKMGGDPKSTTKYLKEKNFKKVFDSLHSECNDIRHEMETKLRDFIVTELKKHYGERDTDWWEQGIPEKIRENSKDRIDAQGYRWKKENFLDFIDYQAIICDKDNWCNIFKIYFGSKKNSGKEARRQTSFLRRIVLIRNDISHSRPLYKDSIKKLKESKAIFNKIYKRWEKIAKGLKQKNYPAQ